MTKDQLPQQRVQRINPGGINYEPAERQVVVWGIHGGSEFVTGIKVGTTTLERSPGEEIEALRLRAMCEVVPILPPDTLRDSKGKAVGYFTYQGLDPDHCKAVAEREGKL